jgi:filamentous hemagglutinin family protein
MGRGDDPMNKSRTRTAGRRLAPAPSPAVAGFRPVAMAAAVAAAFSAAGVARAQPQGGTATHGTVSVQQQGNQTTYSTTNGAGTNHSVINWQSFSVPGGTITHFQQPNAASTSINRVIGNNPSEIFGTLSSNGRLVLVNPAGIAVGKGAVVDTAGFTASTLRMSDADALAGRQAFGDGTGGGALSVNGTVIARNGDVVLVAPDVRVGADAIVRAPNGTTLVAAGQKVALTGRGLEGIQLEMQAPTDQAVNLGRLEGDAVGIFASRLKHSGAIQATAVSTEGGKVVLKGGESLEIDGSVKAARGALGGQVHATANQVMLRSGAIIDVSGPAGGGEALIGGGWQGKDSRVANAMSTMIEAGATVNADATVNGNGGTIVAWSDGATSASGTLTARGGAEGGDGGRIEVSGKHLSMNAEVDLRAPKGKAGSLLLDPTDLCIASDATAAAACLGAPYDTISAPPFTPSSTGTDRSFIDSDTLIGYVNIGNVTVQTANPGGTGNGDITWVDALASAWTGSNELYLLADRNIAINGNITSATGSLTLRAGNTGAGNITQTAAIDVNQLIALAPNGSVTLTNPGNSANRLTGSAGAGGFSYAGTGNTDIQKPFSAQIGSFIDGIQVTGGGNISVSVTGGSLTKVASVTMNGGQITLEADTMSFGGAGTISGTNIAVAPKTPGTAIEVGSATLPGLQLDANTMQTFSASGVLRIGSTSAGNLVVGGAISPVANTLSLKSGGSITQGAGATITAVNLSAEALQTINLSQANTVTGFAGRVGSGAFVNQNMTFQNSGTFELRTLDGISGVSVQNIVGGYNSSSPDGAISLIAGSTGTLGQAAGALIAGKAVYAEAGEVNLTQNNMTGVIAGRTTGALSGGAFRYTSANGISVSNVNGVSGITQNNPAPGIVHLTGTNVTQESGKAITTGGTLQATATSGVVSLEDIGNNAATFTASAAGGVAYRNSGALTAGPITAGSGAAKVVTTAGNLTVAGNISGSSGVELKAESGLDILLTGGSLNAGGGSVSLWSTGGSIIFNGAVVVEGGGTADFEAGSGSILISGGTTLLKSNLDSPQYLTVAGGTLNIGANVSLPKLMMSGPGAVTGTGNLTVTDSLTWNGGTMTGSGSTIIANGATASVNAAVGVARPIVNNGLMLLQGGGSLVSGSGFSLLNNGIFEILNNGAILGGFGTVVNAGVFRRGSSSAATGVSPATAATPSSVGPASIIQPGSFVNSGTLEVTENALQFGSGVFTTNAGAIWLNDNAVLDNNNTSLANAGLIKGNGFLRLGSGVLNNSGAIAPGGVGTVGALGIESPTINMLAGSKVHLDVVSTTSHDKVFVTGDVVFSDGVTVVADLTNATVNVGDTLDFATSTSGNFSGVLPTGGTRLSVSFPTSPAVARATVLAPTGTTTTGELIAQVVPDASTATINAVLSEQDNLVDTFLELLSKEQEEDTGPAKDAVINETSCKR